MKFGSWELCLLSDGFQRLDGGAMFGVVPKVFWEKAFPPDEQNRITLALNCVLVRTADKNILIDTGIGGKESEKFNRIYGVDRGKGGLEYCLSKVGLSAEDIDIVIPTHLHFDHGGGNTRLDEKKRPVPAFPKARYVLPKSEYDDARNAHERNSASYLPHNFEPVAEAGQFDFVEAPCEVIPGVELVPLPGHNHSMVGVLLTQGEEKAFFLADLVPTAAHIALPWIMAFDLNPELTLFTKKEIYARALEEDWLLLFDHEPHTPFGRLSGSPEKPVFVPETIANGDYITPFK